MARGSVTREVYESKLRMNELTNLAASCLGEYVS